MRRGRLVAELAAAAETGTRGGGLAGRGTTPATNACGSRGMRTKHQQGDGFTISVTRTVNASAEAALAAFSDATIRQRWLDAPVVERATRARLAARFDWSEPPSRVMVVIVPKDGDRATITVTHEQLPDVETAGRLKGVWRSHLTALAGLLRA